MSTTAPLAARNTTVRRRVGLGATLHRLAQRATSALHAKRRYAAAEALSRELEFLPTVRRVEAALAWHARQSRVL